MSAKEMFEDLKINEWLELIKEDKNLKGAYICISQYIYLIQKENQELKKQVEEYENELEKADSITQSCIFNGKKESEISYRKCLNMLEKHNNQQKDFINFLEDNYKETQDIWYIKILQKYKSIIGVSDDKTN